MSSISFSENSESQTVIQRSWVFAGIVILGLVLRFFNLGAAPLGESEAQQAYHVLNPADESFVSPLYMSITSFLFWLFGATNFLARLLPALMGSALIFLPLFFQKEQKDGSALWIALWLAIDPGLVAASRQVNTQILLLTTLLFSLVFLWNKKYFLGLLFGLFSIFSTPFFFHILIPVLLTGFVATYFWGVELTSVRMKDFLKTWIWIVFLVVFLLISCFMVLPQNLGGWVNFLPQYLEAWRSSSETGYSLFVFGIIGYESALLFMAILGGVRFFRQNTTARVMLTGAGLILLWVLVFPGKQVLDLIFFIAPLTYLAGIQLHEMIQHSLRERRLSLVFGIALLGIFAYLSQIIFRGFGGENLFLKVLSILIPLLVAMILTLIVMWDSSLSTALHGIYWALGIFLILLSTFSLFRITSVESGKEVWKVPGAIQGERTMLSFVKEVDEWRKVRSTPLTVAIPADGYVWKWVFRNYSTVHLDLGTGLSNGLQPDILVTSSMVTMDNTAGYRGRVFQAGQIVNWALLSPSEWLEWTFSRNLPKEVIQKQEVILWVRNEILAEGLSGIRSSTSPGAFSALPREKQTD